MPVAREATEYTSAEKRDTDAKAAARQDKTNEEESYEKIRKQFFVLGKPDQGGEVGPSATFALAEIRREASLGALWECTALCGVACEGPHVRRVWSLLALFTMSWCCPQAALLVSLTTR